MPVKRAPGSVSAQVGGLALAVLAAAMMAALIAVLLTPEEPPRRLTFGEMLAAAQGRPSPLQRSRARTPPSGPPARLIAAALAQALNKPQTEVQAVWRGDPRRFSSGDEGDLVAIVAGREVVISSDHKGFRLEYGAGAGVSAQTSIPPFEAGVRQSDGAWLIIGPAAPWLAGWRLRLMLWVLLGGGLIAPLIRLGVRRLTRPIQALAEGADRALLFDVATPMPEDGPAEIRIAARAINRMHRRLADAIKDRNRMMAAVAHDLRTPLTALRLRAEAAPPAARERMAADIGRMTAMIDTVLAYARGEEAALAAEPVNLAAIAEACLDDAALTGFSVARGRFEAETPVLGAPDELTRAVQNLLDNAHRYGGRTQLSCFTEGDQAVLRVEDDGPGIPEAQLAEVLEPFVRLEASRSPDTGGAGLGLAIARRAARRHGGELTLCNLHPHGLSAQLMLPARRG